MSDHEAVVRSFLSGSSSGASNLMSLELTGGRVALIGYGWAVYAIKDSDGTVIRYNGWKGYSQSTSTHLNLLDGHVGFESDKQPKTHDVLGLTEGEPPL